MQVREIKHENISRSKNKVLNLLRKRAKPRAFWVHAVFFKYVLGFILFIFSISLQRNYHIHMENIPNINQKKSTKALVEKRNNGLIKLKIQWENKKQKINDRSSWEQKAKCSNCNRQIGNLSLFYPIANNNK